MLKVLLVDGHPLTAKGVQDLLKHEPDFELIGVASTGQAALERIATRQPEVVVLNNNLPDMAAAHLLATIRQHTWPVRVLIFSTGDQAETVRALLEAGASGYLLKAGAEQELAFAIRSLARGYQWFSPEIWMQLADTLSAKSAAAAAEEEEEEEEEEKGKLSKRQKEVLRRVALGHTDSQIALELGVTPKAINRQMERILARLDAPNRTNAVYLATKKGWL